MVEAELVRQATVDRIREGGVALEEVLINEAGAEVGRRIEAHPLLDPRQPAAGRPRLHGLCPFLSPMGGRAG